MPLTSLAPLPSPCPPYHQLTFYAETRDADTTRETTTEPTPKATATDVVVVVAPDVFRSRHPSVDSSPEVQPSHTSNDDTRTVTCDTGPGPRDAALTDADTHAEIKLRPAHYTVTLRAPTVRQSSPHSVTLPQVRRGGQSLYHFNFN